MKTEPTAATATSIYQIMDLELNDLDIDPGAEAFQSVQNAAAYIDTATEAILDEMNALISEMKVAEAEKDQERLHEHFTNMYRAAIEAAGRSVRLAAMARMAIINSDTMRRYDFADPGVSYGKTDD